MSFMQFIVAFYFRNAKALGQWTTAYVPSLHFSLPPPPLSLSVGMHLATYYVITCSLDVKLIYRLVDFLLVRAHNIQRYKIANAREEKQ